MHSCYTMAAEHRQETGKLLLGRMLSTHITHQGRIQGDTQHKVVVSSKTGGCKNRWGRHWIFEQVD
jgi:hypothetical protein